MATQPTSPFTSSASVPTPINLARNQKLVIRCENTTSVQVNIGVGTAVDATHADYFLTGGDAIEIKNDTDTVVNVIAITGTPKVYWRCEVISLWG